MMRQRPSGSNPVGSHNYYGGYSGGTDYSNNSNGYGGYSGGHDNYGGYNVGNGYSTGGHTYGSDDNKYSKSKGSSLVMGNPMYYVLVLLGLWGILTMGLWLNVRTKYNSILKQFKAPNADALLDLYQSLQKDLANAQQEKARSVAEWKTKYTTRQNELERENRLLQKERDELRVKYEGPDKVEEGSRLLLREEAFQTQVELLQAATRKESKRNVLERFGPGPHEVEFTVLLGENRKSFVIEMAPLDYVPHAIHVFLEQVEHGLWNGCFFYLNGPHVVQAGPALLEEDEEYTDAHAHEDEHDDEDRSAAMKPFKALGLDELAFPDYSDKFPHTPWTLGFTGRPGGPDFYINKVDNTESHGPGGQYHHVLEEQGDSCFGKIVRGKDTVAELFAQQVYADRTEWHHFMVEPIEIVKAVVLTKRPAEGSSSVPKIEEPPQPPQHATEEHIDPIHAVNEKLKRKPRLPKIEHAVEP